MTTRLPLFRRATTAGALLTVAIVLVAGPTTAAVLITSADIKNGTIVSADVKDESLTSADVKNGTLTSADVKNGTLTSADVENGSIAAVDLVPELRGLNATMVGASTEVAASFASSTLPTVGTPTRQITVTRSGDILLLGPIAANASASSTEGFTFTAALYLDSTPVPGAAAAALPAFDNCIGFGDPCFSALSSVPIDSLVIRDVPAGTHTLSVRVVGTPLDDAVTLSSVSATIPPFTFVELG